MKKFKTVLELVVYFLNAVKFVSIHYTFLIINHKYITRIVTTRKHAYRHVPSNNGW